MLPEQPGAKPRKLASIETDLMQAYQDYSKAKTAAASASMDETAAKNRVTSLQREFDEVVALVKSSAPVGTDWHTLKNRGEVANG